mmetsp:Transcript_2838/g.6486  ORF Transcript_2838/g.6486 Transcript_2838/m.6486 type:complete len:271 (-) Transcript_2838:32-844(-)
MSPFGRSKHRSSKDSPHSSKTPSRIPGLPPTGRSKAPFSSKATIAKVKGLCEESQVTAQGRCELSGLSPQKADVDADVDHEKPMDNKIDSCHSNGYEPVIVSSPELRVQPPKSENEEKSPLFIEIGHELVEMDKSSKAEALAKESSKDLEKSETQSISRSTNIPLAEWRRSRKISPTLDKDNDKILYADGVFDEGRGSRQLTKRDRALEAIDSLYISFKMDNHNVVYQESVYDNIMNIIDVCVGERLSCDDEWVRDGRYSIVRTISSISH